MPIGELLLKRAFLTEKQLEDALQNQKFFPAKTGTQLVELGFLSLEILERALSEQHGFSCVTDEDLATLDAFCKNQFPIEALERFQVLPFAHRHGVLAVAMVNPGDRLAQDWLQDSSDCRLEIHSISEIRFFYYLFRHFGRDAKPKIRSLAFRYFKERCRASLSGREPVPLRPAMGAISEELTRLGLEPLREGEMLAAPDLQEWEINPTGVAPPPLLPPEKSEPDPEFADFSTLE